MKRGMRGFTTVLASTLVWSGSARAEDKSQQPYIDTLKQGLEPESGDTSGSYSEHLKKELGKDPDSTGESEDYIKRLKETDPVTTEQGKEGGSYTEQEKARLGPPNKESTIAKIKAGETELHPKTEGDIHYAAGFRLGASSNRTITSKGDAGNGNLNHYYGNGYVPELDLFGEWQPFHSEVFGNIGIFGTVGFSYQTGKGQFKNPNLTNPVTGAAFGSISQTDIRFISFPSALGVNYRFNLLKYVRPYVQLGGAAFGYLEYRTDGQSNSRGYATGTLVSGGANILLNPVFRALGWELYDQYGIHHYYLTFDLSKYSAPNGEIDVSATIFSVGMTYEF